MSIYTRKGDDGTTALSDKKRVRKDDQRIETYGTIDELNAHIGLLASLSGDLPECNELRMMQQAMLSSTGYLCHATAKAHASNYERAMSTLRQITVIMEKRIDDTSRLFPPFTCFIIPGGSTRAAQAHVARTVCRRAERRLVAASSDDFGSDEFRTFLNRLSDYLFILARKMNAADGFDDTQEQEQERRA